MAMEYSVGNLFLLAYQTQNVSHCTAQKHESYLPKFQDVSVLIEMAGRIHPVLRIYRELLK